MRYNEISRRSERQPSIIGSQKVAASADLRSALILNGHRAAMPYVVDCYGLARGTMDDYEFEKQLKVRQAWCRSRCSGDYKIEPIRDDEGCILGRRFRFADEGDATLFKTSFC